jgi:hypothetical protein
MKTKGRNAIWARFCGSALGLEDKFLKWCQVKQNSNLIIGREAKYGKMKLFPAVS